MRTFSIRCGKARALRSALLAATASAALVFATPAHALDDFFGLPPIAGSGGNYVNGISGDGRVLVGNTATSQSWFWSNGAYTLFPLAGDPMPIATNHDGSVMVGIAGFGGFYHAAMFNTAMVATDLHTGPAFNPGGSLEGYDFSVATGISADGRVVVGSAEGSLRQAFTWTQATGMVGLGFLPSYSQSAARGISGDGRVIVGEATTPGSQAFYWTQATGMRGLGFLGGGFSSAAHAVNYDGSVIVGASTSGLNPLGVGEAFRWTAATGMVGLGVLPGDMQSIARAVSADGTVIVGASGNAFAVWQAMRWTQATGMQSIASLLTANGVNLGGWVLADARGVSADGKIITGRGTNPLGEDDSWIARCAATCTGMTSVNGMAKSFAGQSAFGQTGNAAISGTLGTMQEYATQAQQTQGARGTPFSIFAYGSYDSDPVTSGTLGGTLDLPGGLIGGLSVSANYVKTNMIYDGTAKMHGGSLGAFIAHAPERGWQWLVGGSALTLKGDVTRGYLNGAGLASSTGSTSGNGYGGVARVGFGFAAAPKVTVMPFASYTASVMRFDGYTETSGVFPAVFAGQKNTAQTSRLGADARYTFAPNSWLWGTLAWAHRLDDGKGADITGALIDAFAMTVPGLSVAKNSFEIGGGVRLPAFKTGAVTASLTASIPSEGVTTYLARVGLSRAF